MVGLVAIRFKIHPVHRRLAELQFLAKEKKGWHMLSEAEQRDFYYCLKANAQLRDVTKSKEWTETLLRLGELHESARRCGSWKNLSAMEQMDLQNCLQINAKLVYRVEGLYQISLHARQMGDVEWEEILLKRIDEVTCKI
jgi:hypothetical protein